MLKKYIQSILFQNTFFGYKLKQLLEQKSLDLRANKYLLVYKINPKTKSKFPKLRKLSLKIKYALIEISIGSQIFFPLDIAQHTQLRSLILVNHLFARILKTINLFIPLKKLNLSKNQFIILSDISHLKKLEVLDLSQNQLRTSPQGIEHLSLLKHLNLANNYLRQFPKEIEQLNQLETLDLSYNPISEIPVEVAKLINLKKLIVHGLPKDQIQKINWLRPGLIKPKRKKICLGWSGNVESNLPLASSHNTVIRVISISNKTK